jgi:hypothetical protein
MTKAAVAAQRALYGHSRTADVVAARRRGRYERLPLRVRSGASRIGRRGAAVTELQMDADRWQGILRVVTYALTSNGGEPLLLVESVFKMAIDPRHLGLQPEEYLLALRLGLASHCDLPSVLWLDDHTDAAVRAFLSAIEQRLSRQVRRAVASLSAESMRKARGRRPQRPRARCSARRSANGTVMRSKSWFPSSSSREARGYSNSE